MGVWRLIKDLQAELMASTELPHVVSVRLLARLDEAERHLGFGRDAAHASQPPLGELVVKADKEVDGGFSSGTPDATLGVTEEK